MLTVWHIWSIHSDVEPFKERHGINQSQSLLEVRGIGLVLYVVLSGIVWFLTNNMFGQFKGVL